MKCPFCGHDNTRVIDSRIRVLRRIIIRLGAVGYAMNVTRGLPLMRKLKQFR